MGNRKPPAPRRRIGVNLVDFTTRQATRPHAQLLRVVSSASSMMTGGVERNLEDAAAGSEPDDQTSLSSSPGAMGSLPSSPPVDMHIQHTNKSAPMAPHMQLTPKPVVSTVPLRETPGLTGRVHDERPPQTTGGMASGSETVTMTVAELESWKKHTVMQIEDHFTSEQLKRIAEFGRVHANLVKEAKEYVFGIETQLKEQFRRERESLQQQAEAYVARFQQENDMLRQHVEALQEELSQLKAFTGTESLSSGTGEEDDEELAVELEGEGETDEVVSTQDLAVAEELERSSVTPSSSPTVDGSSEQEVCLDDVTETMSRTMGIQTPQVPTKSRVVRTAAALDVDALGESPRAASAEIQAAAAVFQPQTETVGAYL